MSVLPGDKSRPLALPCHCLSSFLTFCLALYVQGALSERRGNAHGSGFGTGNCDNFFFLSCVSAGDCLSPFWAQIGRKAVLDVVSRSGQPAPEPRRTCVVCAGFLSDAVSLPGRNMDLSVALQLDPKHRPKVHEDLCVAVVKLHNWEAVPDAPLEQQQQVVKPPTALTTLASQQD